MIDFLKLEDNLLIICPNENKDILVKRRLEQDPLKNVKFISKSEVLEGLSFTYDIDAINFIHTKYNYSFELSKEILNNLKGIKPYNEKLNNLSKIYDDLVSNNLLKFNPDFIKLFNNKKVYINGYSKLDRELTNTLSNNNINYDYLIESINNYTHDVHTFKTMDEEVTYVINNICTLINNGVSLNNIYLYKVPSEYNLLLKKYLIYHNIPFEFNDKVTLYETKIYKNYLEKLKEFDFDEAYLKLKEETKYDNFDALGKIVDTVIKVNYINGSKDEKIDLLNYLAKNTNLKAKHYKESLKEVNDSSIITDNDYIFMLGFSLSTHPVINRDIDFYLDHEKEFLGKNTSTILNKILEDNLIKFIKNTKNLTITFKEKVDKQVFYLSPLVKLLNMKVIEETINNVRYSKKLSQKEVASYYDMDNLYGIKSKWINTYKKNELLYGIFDHKFKGLTSYDGTNNIRLSYSQINEYNKCPFNYFINRILNVNIFDGNFNTDLGTLYHKVLEDSAKGEVKLDTYNEYIETNFKTYKEKYFVKKLLPQVLDVIKLNKDFLDKSYFDKVYAEQKYYYKIDDNSSLMGQIDKVVIDEEDKNLIVVDYKTSDFKFIKEKTKYGIDMQLPIYALLLKENYPEYLNCGMYIQNVCLKKEELKGKQIYSLNGITLDDENNYKRLDPTLGTNYDDEGKLINTSKYIKGLAINKDGSYAKKIKAYDKEVFDDLIKTAKDETLKVIEKIRNGNFEIAPIKFENEQASACEFCKNKDICFMNENDIRRLDYREDKNNDIEGED